MYDKAKKKEENKRRENVLIENLISSVRWTNKKRIFARLGRWQKLSFHLISSGTNCPMMDEISNDHIIKEWTEHSNEMMNYEELTHTHTYIHTFLRCIWKDSESIVALNEKENNGCNSSREREREWEKKIERELWKCSLKCMCVCARARALSTVSRAPALFAPPYFH